MKTDKHKLPVVDKMTQATTAPGVFAAGDIAKVCAVARAQSHVRGLVALAR